MQLRSRCRVRDRKDAVLVSLPVKNTIFRRYCTLFAMPFSALFSDGGSRSVVAGHDIAIMNPFFHINGVFFGTPPGEDGWWRSLSCSAVLVSFWRLPPSNGPFQCEDGGAAPFWRRKGYQKDAILASFPVDNAVFGFTQASLQCRLEKPLRCQCRFAVGA